MIYVFMWFCKLPLTEKSLSHWSHRSKITVYKQCFIFVTYNLLQNDIQFCVTPILSKTNLEKCDTLGNLPKRYYFWTIIKHKQMGHFGVIDCIWQRCKFIRFQSSECICIKFRNRVDSQFSQKFQPTFLLFYEEYLEIHWTFLGSVFFILNYFPRCCLTRSGRYISIP